MVLPVDIAVGDFDTSFAVVRQCDKQPGRGWAFDQDFWRCRLLWGESLCLLPFPRAECTCLIGEIVVCPDLWTVFMFDGEFFCQKCNSLMHFCHEILFRLFAIGALNYSAGEGSLVELKKCEGDVSAAKLLFSTFSFLPSFSVIAGCVDDCLKCFCL